MKTSQWAAAAYCLCIAGGLHAVEKSEPQDPHHTDVEHMLVSDQQREQRRSITDIDLASFTGFVHLIDRSEFDHRFVDFSDLLDTLPGIQVSQSGGTGTFSSVSVRGSSGKQVNIFLDGLLLNSPNSGSASVSQIPSILIERIEAYPDFTPAQLGNANLAGAINFKSRDLSSAQPGAKLSLAKGSFGLENAELSAWGKLSNWEVIGGGSTLTTDNDFPVDHDIFTTTAKRRRNDGYAQDSVFLKLGRRWKSGQFNTLFQSSDTEKELPTTLNQRRDNATLNNQSWRLQTVLDYQLGKIDIGHRAFIAAEKDIYRDPDSTVGLGEDHIETELDGTGLFNTAQYIWGEHAWVLSLELRQDDITQRDKLDSEDIIDAQRNTAILALADSWCLNDQWLLTATVRQYWVEDEVAFSLRDFAASDDIDESAANLGAQWSPSSHLAVKSNIGLLVRIPTLSEKFGSRGLFEGNADLQAEQALSIDAGFALSWPHFSLDTSVFYRQTDDGIVTLFDSRGVGQPQNIAQSDVVGIESEFTYQLTDWLAVDGNATLLDTDNQSDIRAAKGKKLPGIYHQSAGIGLVATTGVARVEVHYQHHDELYYETANAVEADAKKELNASVTTSWRAVTLDFSARNLRDENFLDMNRFPTPGRSYVLTISVEIQQQNKQPNEMVLKRRQIMDMLTGDRTKVQLITKLSALSLALLVSACGGGSSSGGSGPVAGQNTAVVSTKAADFSGSDIQLINLGSDYTAMSGVAPSDQSDTTVARYGEFFYRLGRNNIDTLTKYSFESPSTPIYEHSTLNNPEDASSNPYTVVFVNDQKAYVIQYAENEVLIINPSAQTQGEFIIGGIDLSDYADADASGVAEAADAVIVDDKLFVVMQRLVGFSPAEEGVNAYIAVFDTTTDEEIDTDPNDDPSNRKGIELDTRNPGKLVYHSDAGLFLQATGDAFYSFAGRDPGYTGGITRIDTDDYSTELVVDDGDADDHPYGFVYDLAIVDSENGYFVGYQSYQNTNLYHFNPTTGAATAIESYSGLDITNLVVGPQDNLWIGIGDAAQPRIELFDGQSTVESIGLLQNPGAILFAE